jgi:hypothetical protein
MEPVTSYDLQRWIVDIDFCVTPNGEVWVFIGSATGEDGFACDIPLSHYIRQGEFESRGGIE